MDKNWRNIKLSKRLSPNKDSFFLFLRVKNMSYNGNYILKGEANMKVGEFWRKNKRKIFIVGSTVVVGMVLFLITKDSKCKLDTKGKNEIWREEDNSFMDIERVKTFLDANEDNSSKFAIFREGPNPNEYKAVSLSDDVIM